MDVRKFGLIWVVGAMFMYVGMCCAEEVIGTVKSVSGEVNILRSGESIIGLTGLKLMPEDKIVTGPKSSVGITLQDGTLIAFGAKSVSQLNEFSYDPVKRDGNLLISVLKGSMRFVTGLLGKHNPSAVNIHTPTSTIGIRGTDFIVAVEGRE